MRILYFVLSFICFNQLNAQEPSKTTFKRFGFQMGANISNMDFNKGEPAPTVHIASAWKAGISLGLLLRVPLGEKWLLQPEYNYMQRNGADKSAATNYKLDYFSLPVLVHYKVNPLLSVYAGLQGELLIRATSVYNSLKLNITHDTEERSIAGAAGVEFHLMQSFFLSARYVHGLNHIGIGQRSVVKEFKYESAVITAGLHF